MPQVYLTPDKKTIGCRPDETLLAAALRQGIDHTHACGGNARCSTCRVVILKGNEHCSPRAGEEAALSRQLNFPGDMRLACQTRISGDVQVRRFVVDELDYQLVLTQRENFMAGNQLGEIKRVAILFADINGYTPFAESLPPYDVVHVISRYFHLMGNVVKEYRGQILDYYGDGFMACFGLTESEGAALQSVRAGLQLFAALESLNGYLRKVYGRTFGIRVGVNYGEVIWSKIGIQDMEKLAAIGDAVNLASRIEQANKGLGTHFLISEGAYREVEKEVSIKGVFEVNLKGKAGKYRLYEVTGLSRSVCGPALAGRKGSAVGLGVR
jgi:class 3 adenylate cyclase